MTIIFDIDGTLTNLWPLERTVLAALLGKRFLPQIDALKNERGYSNACIFRSLSYSTITVAHFRDRYNRMFNRLARTNRLPKPRPTPLVGWIRGNRTRFRFVYATGGLRDETKYVLRCLNILAAFNLNCSTDRTVCRYSKASGIPYRAIRSAVDDECLVISDSVSDCNGAKKAGIPSLRISIDNELR